MRFIASLAPCHAFAYRFRMSGVLAQLPEVFDQESFNLERWSELAADPMLAALDGRIETNRFGQIIVIPPPGFEHSNLQGLIFEMLRDLMPAAEGRVRPECPVERARKYVNAIEFPGAWDRSTLPVLNPSNSTGLKGGSGSVTAESVWACSGSVGLFENGRLNRNQESPTTCG
jgi:hypothetical protein